MLHMPESHGLHPTDRPCPLPLCFRDTSGQGRFCTIFRSYSRGAQVRPAVLPVPLSGEQLIFLCCQTLHVLLFLRKF